MAKCRQLLQENEEIGKMISSGRLAKLEGELSMQKALCEEMKKNQIEMDDFVQELDDDMEGMQSTIYFLQQQLKEAKETIANLETHTSSSSKVDLSLSEGNVELLNSAKLQTDEGFRTDENDMDLNVNDRLHSFKGVKLKSEDVSTNDETPDTMHDDMDEAHEQNVVNKECDAFMPSEENVDNQSELDTSLQDEGVDEKHEDLDLESTEGASESPTPLPRGRGRRGTPTKPEKSDVNNKGKRPQRATRGQKRSVTNSSADDADEKAGEDDGTTTVRPKRTRVAPQRLKEEEKE